MPPDLSALHGRNAYAEGPLAAGPMQGEGSPTEARIWVQARSDAPLTLHLHRRGQSGSEQTQELLPRAEDWLCGVFHLRDLDPGTRYEYRLTSPHGETARFPLAPGIASEATTLRIAFGSCYKEYARTDLRIFDAIAAQAPDLFLLLGDTCYTDEADRQSEATMMAAHLRNRNHDRLRALIASVPSLGIWDDHDFGPNDSDGRYTEAERSLRCFVRMWAQRSYGQPTLPGVFSRVVVGPVELFLLDSRFYRRTHQHVLGDAQLDWLMDGLRQSRAPIKLLLSGSQLLPEVAALDSWDWECFRRDGARELSTLQHFLAEEGISGVVALSGDPHLGQLFYSQGIRRTDGQLGPPLWELTSSPIANRPWHRPVWPADSQDEHAFDHYLLREVAAANFGLLDVDLSRAGAELRLSLHSETGEVFFRTDIALDSLAVQPARPHFCAAVRDPERAYVFFGDQYARCSPASGQPAAGYPKAIVDGWHGLFRGWLSAERGLDAVYFSRRGKAYFFCGNGYVRYDLAKDQCDAGYPKYIARHFPGLWPHRLLAALPCPDRDREVVLFICGRDCLRYDLTHDQLLPGYPRPLAEEFSGMFGDEIDGAVVSSDGAYYFRSGDQVLRYEPTSREPSPGYPRTVPAESGSHWLGFLPS